jgi:hypothetical protein
MSLRPTTDAYPDTAKHSDGLQRLDFDLRS